MWSVREPGSGKSATCARGVIACAPRSRRVAGNRRAGSRGTKGSRCPRVNQGGASDAIDISTSTER